MGVVSDGNCYGFPEGVVCSAPVRSEGGEWKVMQDFHLTPTIQVKSHILIPCYNYHLSPLPVSASSAEGLSVTRIRPGLETCH